MPKPQKKIIQRGSGKDTLTKPHIVGKLGYSAHLLAKSADLIARVQNSPGTCWILADWMFAIPRKLSAETYRKLQYPMALAMSS